MVEMEKQPFSIWVESGGLKLEAEGVVDGFAAKVGQGEHLE